MTERISFFSPELHSNVLPILNKFINECVNIRAVISFWALDHHLLDPSFLNKIKGHGFLCVDFHTPTNIDEICAIASHDTNVFLHLYKAAGKTEIDGTYRMPQHLLHSKIFLFEMPDDTIKIWIGSHNATNRALLGLNIESSILVETSKDNELYNSINTFLHSVKKICTRVQPDLIDYYRWLQSNSGNKKILELFDFNGFLSVGSQFALFLTDLTDVRGLQSVGSRILLSITSVSGDERFFWGEIGQSGYLKDYPEIKFSISNYAFRNSSTIPNVENEIEVPPRIVDDSKYFAVISLIEPLDHRVKAVEPISKKWIRESSYEQPFISKDINYQITTEHRDNLIVYKAVHPDNFLMRSRNHYDRSNDTNRRLITTVSLIQNSDI